MRVQDVMTTEVRTVRSDTLLKEAAELLAEHRISGVPVVDADDHVVGVLSEGDILFKERGVQRKGVLERLLSMPETDFDLKLNARTVGEAMSAPAATIDPKRKVSEAANRMIDESVNRLPVVDDEGKLIGIVTRADLVRAFVRSDEEIGREIREEVILRTLWLAPEAIDVKVDGGEVHLAGEVETKADAELIPAFVQRVPGVVSVASKLRWREEDDTRSGRLLAWHKQP